MSQALFAQAEAPAPAAPAPAAGGGGGSPFSLLPLLILVVLPFAGYFGLRWFIRFVGREFRHGYDEKRRD